MYILKKKNSFWRGTLLELSRGVTGWRSLSARAVQYLQYQYFNINILNILKIDKLIFLQKLFEDYLQYQSLLHHLHPIQTS